MLLSELAGPKFTVHKEEPEKSGSSCLVMSNRSDDGFYDDYLGILATIKNGRVDYTPLCAKSRAELKAYEPLIRKAVLDHFKS